MLMGSNEFVQDNIHTLMTRWGIKKHLNNTKYSLILLELIMAFDVTLNFNNQGPECPKVHTIASTVKKI